jgi:hypothetical protein
MHRATPFLCVIEGEAKGADSLARQWAYDNDIPVEKYPADWTAHGRAAGPIRNRKMLTEGKPDIVVAFPSVPLDQSKGTRNMVEQARKADIKVIVAEGGIH